jgi:hypothetical protein
MPIAHPLTLEFYYLTAFNMASFKYHALPGFGEECREKYGFSDACLIGNRLVVTGQSKQLTRATSEDLGLITFLSGHESFDQRNLS